MKPYADTNFFSRLYLPLAESTEAALAVAVRHVLEFRREGLAFAALEGLGVRSSSQ